MKSNDTNNSTSTTGIHNHHPRRMEKLQTTLSTIEQQCTENEVMPFFVTISTLPKSQIQHLQSVGLIVPVDEVVPTTDNISTSSITSTKNPPTPDNDTVVVTTIVDREGVVDNNNNDDNIIEIDLTNPESVIDLTANKLYKDESKIEMLTTMENEENDDENRSTEHGKMDMEVIPMDDIGTDNTITSTMNNNDDDDNISTKTATQSSSSSAAAAVSLTLPLYDVCLVRNKHIEYIKQIWDCENNYPPLRSSFTSLDSSRPWMIYWCLHSYDLLVVDNNNSTNPIAPRSNIESTSSTSTQLPPSLTSQQRQMIVQTLSKCFTKLRQPLQIPADIVQRDTYLMKLLQQSAGSGLVINERDSANTSTSSTKKEYYEFTNVGGFGGNIDQMAHAATTYAAINALCILAPTEPSAVMVVDEIKPMLYPWLVSLLLPQNNGSFRMHHDGEIDVRASYCVLSSASLLGYFSEPAVATTTTTTTPTSALLDDTVIQYISKCQTWEGGFSGEPFGEAHGGYTFCAIAAIQIWMFHHYQQQQTQKHEGTWNDRLLSIIDVPALTGWLVRRQMSFEGGFNGRCNKLVDGCYSFWQGSGTAIAGYWEQCIMSTSMSSNDSDDDANKNNTMSVTSDPWMISYTSSQHQPEQQQQGTVQNDDSSSAAGQVPSLLFDVGMLQRYILLCAQDVNGGLRDKPSKSRDFYHTCYNLSGLSVSQYQYHHQPKTATKLDASVKPSSVPTMIPNVDFGHIDYSVVNPTHPCYNIQLDKVRYIQNYYHNLAKS